MPPDSSRRSTAVNPAAAIIHCSSETGAALATQPVIRLSDGRSNLVGCGCLHLLPLSSRLHLRTGEQRKGRKRGLRLRLSRNGP